MMRKSPRYSPYKRLAAAMLHNAVNDLKFPRRKEWTEDARVWLQGADAEGWAMFIRFDLDGLRRKLRERGLL